MFMENYIFGNLRSLSVRYRAFIRSFAESLRIANGDKAKCPETVLNIIKKRVSSLKINKTHKRKTRFVKSRSMIFQSSRYPCTGARN